MDFTAFFHNRAAVWGAANAAARRPSYRPVRKQVRPSNGFQQGHYVRDDLHML